MIERYLNREKRMISWQLETTRSVVWHWGGSKVQTIILIWLVCEAMAWFGSTLGVKMAVCHIRDLWLMYYIFNIRTHGSLIWDDRGKRDWDSDCASWPVTLSGHAQPMLKRKAVDVETNPLLVAAKRLKKDVMILLYPFYSWYWSILEEISFK